MAHDMQHDTDAGGGDEEAGAAFKKAFVILCQLMQALEIGDEKGDTSEEANSAVFKVMQIAHNHTHEYPEEFHFSLDEMAIGGLLGDRDKPNEPPTGIKIKFTIGIDVEMQHPDAPEVMTDADDKARLN